MLGLVVAPNIFQMYIFWELVGVSSYLLIGFYYTKPEAIAASKKAFIVTRFADLGFLLGILLLSYFTKTFSFELLTSGDASVFAGAAGVTFMGASVMSWALALISSVVPENRQCSHYTSGYRTRWKVLPRYRL